MSARSDRAFALLDANRPQAALEEFTLALGEDPDDVVAHLGIAACHCAAGRWDLAADAARRALAAAPALSHAHSVLARAELAQGRRDAARTHAEEALRLDPGEASHYALLASVHADAERWTHALDAAVEGLAVDPEHEECMNLRALALIRLGRRREGADAAEASLALNPESETAHTARGLAALEEGDHVLAQRHFTEALRIDPESEVAREGLVTSIKATWRLYRWWLAVVVRIGRLPAGAQLAVWIGGYVVVRTLRTVARTKPGLEPLALTVAVVWIAFVAASWLADPIANVLLRFHPVGRHALAREAQREAAIVAALLLVAGANVGCLFLGGGLVFVVAAAVSAALVLPVVAFHQRERGTRMRLAFGIWGALLALVGAVAIGCLAAAPARDHDHPAFLAGLLAAGAFLLGAIATTWASAGVRVLESRSRG